ncbi:helix-turn-helix domain-containing protein [Embleya hyalina]|uniref:helix-turn-helix domain-containing protein n=1 Tax=Embleya hyalina TaxID=516124 RepID=UPI000F84D288|nr:helix-turn-helix domain-containing protein [Embleya hyalina]
MLGVDDVATYLGRPSSWVYENWRPLKIPFRKIGRTLRCRPADLERWIDQQN